MNEKTTAELEIEVSESRNDDVFMKVEASKLSLEDEFMKYQPKTINEMELKGMITSVIQNNPKDFWRPVCDPSFDDNRRICYEPGKVPAVGKSYNRWEKTAKEFKHEQGSRLGTKSEYVAFLAVLIKELFASGKSLRWAWNAVCNDSKELGHYCNSKGAKYTFETTGSRDICGWYDLANTCKILAEDIEAGGFWLAGGCYHFGSKNYPLANLHWYDSRDVGDVGNNNCCGWLVLEN